MAASQEISRNGWKGVDFGLEAGGQNKLATSQRRGHTICFDDKSKEPFTALLTERMETFRSHLEPDQI